ncbi:LysR substrate-binding domain-containing protein [Crateriforma conspicua]|uniref:HTH-type transcriptional regulator CynR n=1 Tax=Crateriforma conspicua TaxID=2527996 RepID=A0A5C5YA64_9PLAN|nr:LysR substrate-binding domain-containing protein [Crateriforma conspicua]TWT71849.1 HTH-type transcriptional regulator CynR [Crateriforma conspicua]TWU62720.1 HTH-type transcriptional regulator CynR [Crateriforma conspicua]
MELRHLRYFLAISNHTSFRIAAEELLVSQPTLSQQMKDLEKELGCSLFERAGRGIRLTQAGVLFGEYAQRAINVLDEGQAAIDEFDQMLRGRIRVGVVQTVGAYLIPPVVAEFKSQNPGVQLVVHELSADDVENGLVDGSLDLGISFEPTRRQLHCRWLFGERFVLIVPAEHLWANRRRIRLDQMAGEPLCLMTKDFCTRRMIDAAFAQNDVELQVAVEMTSVAGCLAVTNAGGPPTILPELAMTGTDLSGIRIESPMIRRSVCLLQASEEASIRATSEFADAVIHHVGAAASG